MRIPVPTEDTDVGISLTSMLDVVFNLLVFFLVATTMASEEREIAVQLPGTASFRPLSAPPQQLVLNVKDDGSTIVSGRTYDPQALSQLLTKTAREDPNKVVLIRADERGPHKHFAGVARMAKQAGIKEVKIGYLVQDPQQ
jgi:biopolymer transport protein ExbD